MIEYYCVYISVELTLLSIRVLCALILTLWINPLHSTKHFSSRLFCVVLVGFFPNINSSFVYAARATCIINILFAFYSEKYWSLYEKTIFVHTN